MFAEKTKRHLALVFDHKCCRSTTDGNKTTAIRDLLNPSLILYVRHEAVLAFVTTE